MSNYTLYHGDCLDIMPTLAVGSVDLTVTSPPYDNLRDYGKDFDTVTFDWKSIIKSLHRVTKVGGVVVWVVADATIKGSETGTSFRQALWAMECGFRLETMVYESSAGASGSNSYYWQAFEYMFIFVKGKVKKGNLIHDKINIHAGRATSGERRKRNGTVKKGKVRIIQPFSKRTNIWRYVGGDHTCIEHPAIFPESLANDHIISWSNPGDVVFDPMMGSGTTGKMAMRTGRNFIGIELDKEYFDIAENRIKNAAGDFVMTKKEKATGQIGIFDRLAMTNGQ